MSRTLDYALSRAQQLYCCRAFLAFSCGNLFRLFEILISDDSQVSALSSLIGFIRFFQSQTDQNKSWRVGQVWLQDRLFSLFSFSNSQNYWQCSSYSFIDTLDKQKLKNKLLKICYFRKMNDFQRDFTISQKLDLFISILFSKIMPAGKNKSLWKIAICLKFLEM